jgi:uncharacterized protein
MLRLGPRGAVATRGYVRCARFCGGDTLPGLLFVLGVVVGAYGTLIGAGGGFVLMPLLLFLYPQEAVPALTSLSLSVVALNAASGTFAYARRRRIDYRLALLVAATAAPGSVSGALVTPYIPRSLFEASFGVVLLALATIVLARPAEGRRRSPDPTEVLAPAVYARWRLGMALSAAVGCLAGVLGIGGAPPLVVVLTHVMQVPVWRAMPTVQFIVLLAATGAVATHALAGEFTAGLVPLLSLGPGALLGAQLGAAASDRLSGRSLVRLLAVALVVVGAGLVLKSLR